MEHLRQSRLPYALIEKDPTVVDDLVRAGEPVVVDDAKQESTLIDAGVDHAHLIVITSTNIETALLVTKRARDFESFLARIYVDRCARAAFQANPRAEALRAGLSQEECAALENTDWIGLEMAARSFAQKRRSLPGNVSISTRESLNRGIQIDIFISANSHALTFLPLRT